jgi:hypothetical protein
MDLTAIGPALDELADSATEVEVVGELQRVSALVEGKEQQDTFSDKLSVQDKPAIEFSGTSTSKTSLESRTKIAESGAPRYRVHFGSTSKALAAIVR